MGDKIFRGILFLKARKRIGLLTRRLGLPLRMLPMFFDKEKALNAHPFLISLKNNGRFKFSVTYIIPFKKYFINVHYFNKAVTIPFYLDGSMCTEEQIENMKRFTPPSSVYWFDAFLIYSVWSLLQRLPPKEVIDILIWSNMNILERSDGEPYFE